MGFWGNQTNAGKAARKAPAGAEGRETPFTRAESIRRRESTAWQLLTAKGQKEAAYILARRGEAGDTVHCRDIVIFSVNLLLNLTNYSRGMRMKGANCR